MQMLAAFNRDWHPSLTMSFAEHLDRQAVEIDVSTLQGECFTETESGIEHQHQQRPCPRLIPAFGAKGDDAAHLRVREHLDRVSEDSVAA
jgi:hypothetical protein